MYKGYKEGFAPLQNLINQLQKPLPPPAKVKTCGMMTSYGQQNCNKTITTEGQHCYWDTSIKNSYGGTCVTKF